MPELSRFFGIIIAMYYNDHAPAHFHAKYGDQQATIRVDDGRILEGGLSNRAARLVEEWRQMHVDELEHDWKLARLRHPLRKIAPLE